MRRGGWVLVLTMVLATGVSAYGQSRKEIYELQERCGKRAAEIFEKDFPQGERKGLELYENHYSIRLNKCFLFEENTLITRDQGKTTSTKLLTLIDVNANKIYGSFSPLNCDVQDTKCRSEQEFREFIRQYMED